MNIPPDPRPSISTDDESDIGVRREFKRMKARLAELEHLYATRFRHQVPTAVSERPQPIGQRCKFHLHVVVHEHAARVECVDCGEPLDPLDVLRQFAREERNFAFTLEHLRREKSDLVSEVDALKRQRNSLRSAVRKLGARPLELREILSKSEEMEQ